MKCLLILLTATVPCLWPSTCSADEPVLPLRILFIGKAKGDRAADYSAFLKKQFKKVTVVDRVSFDPATAKDADVVVLDWS
jgi:hypothetical protein